VGDRDLPARRDDRHRLLVDRPAPTPGGRPVIRSFPRPRDATQFVVAVIATLLFVLPVYIALASAFKSQAQILASPLGLPAPVTFDNLSTALDRPDHLVTGGVANSLVITVLSVGILIP